MNEKELKKAKKNAKELIKNNDNFIVLTQDDIIGCSSLSEIWLMLVVGLRNIKRDLMTKTLMQEMCNLVMCDNMDEYLGKNGKKITEELEKNK